MNHTLLYIIAGYLSGSILSARICSSFMKKDILIYSNDNNPGAANAFTYGGFFCGIITLFGDILKGFLPVYCYLLNAGGMSAWIISGYQTGAYSGSSIYFFLAYNPHYTTLLQNDGGLYRSAHNYVFYRRIYAGINRILYNTHSSYDKALFKH